MALTREQLSELLSAYLDGEVDAREKEQAESALRADPAARRLLEELSQTAAVVASLPRHAAPPNLAMEMDAQWERAQLLSGFHTDEKDADLRTKSWRTSLKAAAMLVMVLGAGWWFLALQQERRPSGATVATVSRSEDSGARSKESSPEGSKTVSEPLETEALLASGVDPIVLVEQSFDPEPIRLRVVASNAAERDAMSKRFTLQLAVSNTENLAKRKSSSEKKQSVGAFYLEGKPGINYANPQERQILVRLPESDLPRIVDDVAAVGRIPSDQFALQVGPAVVRGPEKARGMLQMMTEKDQPLQAGTDDASGDVANSRNPSPSRGLLNTLGEAVGLGPVMQGPPSDHADESVAAASGESTERERHAGKSGADSEISDADGIVGGERADYVEDRTVDKKAEATTHRSLVSTRLEQAKARRLQESAGSSPVAAVPMIQPDTKASALSPNPETADPFITMVIEFVIPDSKPPPPKAVRRGRS